MNTVVMIEQASSHHDGTARHVQHNAGDPGRIV
jgi:hypothetical protein